MPAWPPRPHPLRTPARAERSAARTEAHYFQTPRRARTVKSPSWTLPTTPLRLLAAGTRCFHRGCWLSSCGKDRLVPTCLEDAAWESTGDDAAMDGGDVCARHRRIRARTVTTPHAAAGVSVPSVAAPMHRDALPVETGAEGRTTPPHHPMRHSSARVARSAGMSWPQREQLRG